jgi:protein-S-isoprenylcysteine O-methyltransferase Ste14
MIDVMTDQRHPARHPLAMAYAVLAYSLFVVVVGWAICFLAGIGPGPSVDGPARLAAFPALAADAGLLLLFAVQHTVMARAGFKRALTRRLPASAERSTYVLTASLLLGLAFWQWQPVPASIWRVSGEPWALLFWVACGAGWLVAVAATFMVDHLGFLGLRQAGWRAGPDARAGESAFAERWLYRWVRHPMMLGLVVAFWATPAMTAGHLFFAMAGTGYILVGVRFEERDLRRQFGDVYRDYAGRVPALVPAVRSGQARR